MDTPETVITFNLANIEEGLSRYYYVPKENIIDLLIKYKVASDAQEAEALIARSAVILNDVVIDSVGAMARPMGILRVKALNQDELIGMAQ